MRCKSGLQAIPTVRETEPLPLVIEWNLSRFTEFTVINGTSNGVFYLICRLNARSAILHRMFTAHVNNCEVCSQWNREMAVYSAVILAQSCYRERDYKIVMIENFMQNWTKCSNASYTVQWEQICWVDVAELKTWSNLIDILLILVGTDWGSRVSTDPVSFICIVRYGM